MAFVKAVNTAKTRRYNDPSYWPDVYDEVTEIVPEEDMKSFKNYCDWGEHGLGEYAADNIDDFIMCLKVEKDKGVDDDSDNMPAELFEESEAYQDARDGYLAREMWKGYREWLSHRPGELERFHEFMVSSVCCFIIQSRFFTNVHLAQVTICLPCC